MYNVYMYSSTNMTSFRTGINELEGAVLMGADEYLKISHEVKALKTAMLKLKRELQTDLQVSLQYNV